MNALLVVRARAGLVGEASRLTHVVPVPEPGTDPEYLHTYCGVRIQPGGAETVTVGTGMPCEVCLAQARAESHRNNETEWHLATVLEQLATGMPSLAENIRQGRLSPERLTGFGDLLSEVAELCRSAAR